MPMSSNPLRDMSEAVSHADSTQTRPNESFTETALPGFKRTLQSRRSIREFDGNPIPESVMLDCLRDAVLAPTSSNLQSYELYWVRDPSKKKQIARACLGQPVADTAGEFVVVVARHDRWRANLDRLLSIMTHDGTVPLPEPVSDYYTRIVPMLMKTDPLGLNNLIRRCIFWFRGRREPCIRGPVSRADHRIYGHVQATFAAQTLLLSIAAHGYESCPIGGMDRLRIAEVLDLPKPAEVSLVIAAGTGTPQGLYGRRIRLPQQELVKTV